MSTPSIITWYPKRTNNYIFLDFPNFNFLQIIISIRNKASMSYLCFSGSSEYTNLYQAQNYSA